MRQRNIGCKIGNKFLGVFGYSDDLTLLCPTLSGLQEMLNVCEDFSKDYNILFNASKSKLMYFGKDNLHCENLLCMSNSSSIEFVEQCVHLGTKIYSDISKKNIDNASNDLYVRTNNLMADFTYAQSSTLSILHLQLSYAKLLIDYKRSPVTSQTVTGSRLTGYIVNVMLSPVIERLMVRGSQVALSMSFMIWKQEHW